MLKLQKIELLGFKSFADKTEIVFNDGGVAAIVGPNGCGKSNISDAINWVLGEQSAKTLRSGRMQDVIFNGTPGRKATGMAEVHLTLFDSDMEVTPSPEIESSNGHHKKAIANLPNGQITVSRRLFSSGESEYLMNGRPCRLRDVQDIFLGTGLGPDAYAVIEQGRIGQILTSKPYELRGIIEEAAGVTKFKAKRKLAWAKLESSKQNLSRVNDILEEIGRQLNSLKRQAARAQRYTELRELMRSQLRIVLANHYREKEQDGVRVALELGMLNRSLQERVAFTESRETEQRDTHELFEQEEAQLRQAIDERAALRLAAERARSQSASQAQQIGYLASRIEESVAEKTRVEARVEDLNSERRACVAFVSQIQNEVESLTKDLRESESRFQNCQSVLKDKERKLAQLRQEMLDAVGRCATLRNQVLQLEQFLNNTDRQIERGELERSSVEAEREAATTKSGEIQASMLRQREELSEIGARRTSLEQDLRSNREEEARQRVALDHLRSGLAAQRGRMASLEEILASRAYSTEAVKRLFEAHHANAATAAAASNENGWHGFEPVGVLADFIEVDATYERTVEEFLREELDYIVVKDWDAAKRGVHLLRTEVPGRATFLLHSGADAHASANGNGHGYGNGNGNGNGNAEDHGSVAVTIDNYETLPGVLGSLEGRVRLTNGFSNAASTLLPKLRQCYLVADADAGRALAAQHPNAYFLTPEGDWFHGDLITAGHGDNTGPLALKREFRELTRNVVAGEENAAQTAAHLAALRETIEQQQAALQALVEEQQQAEKQLVVAERDWKDSTAHCQRLGTHLETIRLEVERLRHEAERARKQLADDAEEIARREQRRTEIEIETAEISAVMSELEGVREEAHRQTMETRSRLAALDERRRASMDALARIDKGIAEHRERLALLGRQREDWTRRKADYEESNQRLEQEANAAEQHSEELAVKVADMESSYEQRRQKLAELDVELQALRRDTDEMREKKSACEVQLARLESELIHLKESCRNELQFEMEELAAQETAMVAPEELVSAEQSYQQLKAKIEGMGPINMMALEEYEECRQRHDFLQVQRQDLLDSIRDTTQAIQEIDEISQRQFSEAFEQININFQQMFQVLFGGGQGMLRLTEAENAADRGVEIIAQPPGKKLQNVLLLSGGEKALTAIALLLGTFRYKPSPFCVLDEVDAPLDEANVGRFARMVQEMSRDTQFILITHSKKTMSVAPVLYGVTMEDPGVSKIVSVRFNGTTSPLAPPRELAEAVL
ncbi:MAG: AAA family ATPase [Acidobacteria bacterium]|nr:AAA family ATPase [Acidobacteriota bacterium]